MSVLICPKCGKRSDEIAFIDAFCNACYPINIKAPDSIELEQCTRCDKIRLRGEWTPYGERKITELLESRCRGDFDSVTYDFVYQTASFGIKSGTEHIEKKIPLNLKKTICQQCSRISGGYFEGIIQLRGDRNKMGKYAEMFTKKLAKKTFIAKTEEKEEGLDLYIGNSKTIVALMGEMGLKVLITKKLVGRDQGKRLYRTTFLVRL